MDDVKELYDEIMPTGGFILNEEKSDIEEGVLCYKLTGKGEGEFWNYFYKNMFIIEKQDFKFYDDFFLETQESDFIAVQFFFSVSGEELQPYRQLSPNMVRCYVGDKSKTYRAIYHKNVPIRSVGINIMPEFYNKYLKEKLGGRYIDPRDVFERIGIGMEFPNLVTILKQINNYNGTGISAKLFFEAKVLEAIAIILEEAENKAINSKKIPISKKDEENLRCVADYIDHHFNFSITNEQLCKISYMSETKLKTKFKEYFGLTITNYILQKRIEQAQHLLIGTDLSIAEIAKVVGYSRPENFSKQFKRITGILPHNYRKLLEE